MEKLQNNNSIDHIVDLVVAELQKSLPEKIFSTSTTDIPVGVSNRHIHLTKATFHALFGDDVSFESMRPLYQPGEFASKHTLTVVGPKMRPIHNIRILGPLRDYDQVELSFTDSIVLGAKAPYRNSGDLKDAAPLTLIGPKKSLYLEHCAIVASRHIHMTSSHAMQFGVKAGDYCRVRTHGVKSTVFENVLVRINDSWKLEMHLDTDDANAALVEGSTTAEFIEKM